MCNNNYDFNEVLKVFVIKKASQKCTGFGFGEIRISEVPLYDRLDLIPPV